MQPIARLVLIFVTSTAHWFLMFIIIVLAHELVSEVLLNKPYGLLEILQTTFKDIIKRLRGLS